MFRQVTLEEFKQAAIHQKQAIVFQEFPCDDLTPIYAFLALKASQGSVLLESAVKDEERGRYSLLGIEPFAKFQSKGSDSQFFDGQKNQARNSCPFDHLKETVKALQIATPSEDLPMLGGAVGFLTYDAVRLFEKVPERHLDHLGLPDLFFLFHTVQIVFDHQKGRIFISIVKSLSENLEKDYAEALEKIAEIRAKLKEPIKEAKTSQRFPCDFLEEIEDAAFCDKVRKAQEFIYKGDAFQIVLSRSWSCPYLGNPFDIYRGLRMVNPSPFMFYIDAGEYAIAGASPESLVKVNNGRLQTTPIAGSRPREGREDETLIAELMQDPKEEAEHIMLVDLGRNDLGKVAQVGSVQVKEFKQCRLFPHIIHLVSRVEAQLAEEYDVWDALKAVFPAGTLTGAPKIRAMEIIDELEESRRGLYGGAICTLDNSGNLESCIAIRTALIKDGIVSIRCGGGIVLDSDPEKEAEETRAKAKGVIQAVQLAMSGVL